jgi:hypothetical protein
MWELLSTISRRSSTFEPRWAACSSAAKGWLRCCICRFSSAATRSIRASVVSFAGGEPTGLLLLPFFFLLFVAEKAEPFPGAAEKAEPFLGIAPICRCLFAAAMMWLGYLGQLVLGGLAQWREDR